MFDLPFGPENWLALLTALTLSALALNGLYLAAAITITDYQAFMVLSNVSMPVLVFSAPSMYTTESMPTVLQWVSVVNPLTYAINGMRDGAVFGFGEAWADLLVLAVMAVVGYAVGGRALLKRAGNI
jgi:ABC-2 type transport system permease protein